MARATHVIKLAASCFIIGSCLVFYNSTRSLEKPIVQNEAIRDTHHVSHLSTPVQAMHDNKFNCPYIPSHNVTVCIHPPKRDIYISKLLSKGKMFDADLVNLVLASIQRDPTVFLLDIGTNIGAFSLSAAARGYNVLSFEPFPPNQELLEESIRRNHFEDRVTLLKHGISDGHYNMSMDVAVNNMGRVQLTEGRCVPGVQMKCSKYKTTTFTLDDVPKFKPEMKKVFMKVDVEGHERQVILGAHTFWKSIQVCEIFMEWQWFTLYFNEDPVEIAHTDKMIDALLTRGFEPRSLKGKPLDKKDWKSSELWPNNIMWINTQC